MQPAKFRPGKNHTVSVDDQIAGIGRHRISSWSARIDGQRFTPQATNFAFWPLSWALRDALLLRLISCVGDMLDAACAWLEHDVAGPWSRVYRSEYTGSQSEFRSGFRCELAQLDRPDLPVLNQCREWRLHSDAPRS